MTSSQRKTSIHDQRQLPSESARTPWRKGKTAPPNTAHHENAGSLGGVFFQSHGSERENAPPHHGMKQPHRNQHPQVMGVNAASVRRAAAEVAAVNWTAGGNMAQPAGNNTPRHQAAPVQGGQQGGNAQVHSPHYQIAGAQKQQGRIRIAEFQRMQVHVDSHGNLRAHVKENGDDAQCQMAEGTRCQRSSFSPSPAVVSRRSGR